MMGRKQLRGKWFYNFSLVEERDSQGARKAVSEVVDFAFVRDLVGHTYSHTGTPSVDPVVVFKMTLWGYLYGIT